MKIATWNVNSLNVRLPQVLEWLEAVEPDVLAMQETKVSDEQFPVMEFQAAGYEAVFAGQRSYNGVAIVSRKKADDVVRRIPALDDEQRRFIGATVNGVRVLDLYVVNGQEVGSEKYAYKLEWLQAVTAHLETELEHHDKLVVLGDFNIAPEDRDVYDPRIWHERIMCSTPEREALGHILALGLQDTFRLFEQPRKSFTWWDYRSGAFRRNWGLRIDLVLASRELGEVCRGCTIDTEPRHSERPSDHAPVVAEFDA
ncbi:MAG: exodeoxyribonuclease III [Gammaproteobacteria bacterium]|nr:exodeoxyribonuclease III [Gammaproteobacteria bacterium]NIR84611.1 exodeoxyribonuclease III [Gammaproteobacteria bacterium]NIR90514.1 exodeoxyribonuclease III [Gammaproteobacteria bacterium]NIU05662.1 exodeoxyribonuclease III [Gammaproteobacteria bacterium]NIV52801.1 exodeoxyribonuclease III [Gammaproteobacteria bacterium]